MDYTSLVNQWSAEYEKENGQPTPESVNNLFRSIAGLMASAYEEGARVGAEKAQSVKA